MTARWIHWATVAAAAIGLGGAAHAAEKVRVGGTGIGLATAQALGAALQKADPGISVEVARSLGTPAGLRALAQGAIEVAVAARSLLPEERAQGLREASCLKTALIFVTSHPTATGVERKQLPAIYNGTLGNWPDGAPLRPILRLRAGMEMPYLAQAIPGMERAVDAAFARRGIPVGTTDQENVTLAQEIPGSFAVSTLLQVRSERPQLRVLDLDGVAPTAASVADSSYPLLMRVCFTLPAAPSPGAQRFVDFVNSQEGRAILHGFEAAPDPVP
ncbi:substrate-binding domain-containing protein [Azospirillum sp. TSO22-1]|uniref:substrate-binding domain-containing protein n=1 Tax=Azospirillum sp. TSO22-1 TaxID=716789 RepID=UPI000D61E656|nr:substrate-binding domain-containing protein [Azospirillum sp. TSO22-1]PWC53919.1 hypothetical protein TSO221_09300 [Azospirillum sp. TSO22-1]